MAPSRRSQKVVPVLVPRTTRNRSRHYKHKLISDTEQSTKQLTSQLRALGLYAAPTLGDGNCLFRALSDQLWGFPSGHSKLRAEICDWMESQKERYEGFVDEDRTFDTHLNLMRISGTYGGHLELSAFAHLKRRNVKVIQPGLVYVIEWNCGWTCDTGGSGNSDELSSLTEADVADRTTMSQRDARRLRREGQRDKKKHEKEKKVTLEEEFPELEQQGAVYVAYHDWGHYSSIRNITGPHAGLPTVVETLSPKTYEDHPPSTKRLKPGKATTRVNSATPSKIELSSTMLARIPAESFLSATPSASISRSSSVSLLRDGHVLTPSLVPLPPSRSVSPLVPIYDNTMLSPPASQISTDTNTSSRLTPITATLGSILATTLSGHTGRSPKRTLDETEETQHIQGSTMKIEQHTFTSSKRHRLRSFSKDTAHISFHPNETENPQLQNNIHNSTPSLSSDDSSQEDHPHSSSRATPASPARALRSNGASKDASRPAIRIDTPTKRQKRRAAVKAMHNMNRSGVSKKTARTSTQTAGGKASQVPSSTRILRSTSSRSITSADPLFPANQEWQNNGLGRLDIRGFRELKI